MGFVAWRDSALRRWVEHPIVWTMVKDHAAVAGLTDNASMLSARQSDANSPLRTHRGDLGAWRDVTPNLITADGDARSVWSRQRGCGAISGGRLARTLAPCIYST